MTAADRAEHLALVLAWLAREPAPFAGLTVPQARVQALVAMHRDRKARARTSEGSPPA